MQQKLTKSFVQTYRNFIIQSSFNTFRKCGQTAFLLAVVFFMSSAGFSKTYDSASASAIDSYFRKLEAFGLSGSLLIGNKKQILLKKNYGVGNSSKNIDYAYSVGSITKQFTASAILVLEQRGLLNTNDKISAHLSDIPKDKSNITIHQLLTHTSGLKDDYWDQNRDLTEEEYIKKILSKKLTAEPGTRFAYINFGYHLLKKIIEKKTNKSYENFMVEDIFRPNGLKFSGFKLVKWKKNQVVNYNDWTMSESKIENLAYPLKRPVYLHPEGSGGLLSTTNDLYKWYRLLFNSTKLLNEDSKKKLLRVEKNNYGYGWNITQTSRGTKLVSHGGYDSWLGVVAGFYNFVDEDIVVIFLGNTHMSQILRKDDLMKNIESIIFGGSVQIPPTSTYNLTKSDLQNVLGNYKRNEKNVSISKGKINNQIRLRTKDQELIKQLLFPQISKSENLTDVQFEFFFNQIAKNDYAPLKGTYLITSTFEGAKARYSSIWKNLTSFYGKYKGFRVLHVLPNTFEGKFELQIFMELKFEKGSFYARGFRDHNGRLHVQNVPFPKKLELYLIPKSKDEFIGWNIKTNTSATIKIDKNGLIVNDNDEIKYTKQ